MKKYFIILFLFNILACENILHETAKKDTTAAIYYQAKKAMNRRDYDSAITLLTSLGPTYLAQRDVAAVYASAYSGRCGLDLVTLLTELDSISSSAVFLSLMQLFPEGSDSKITDCVTSEGILKGFGNETQRTADENVLMGLSSITKVGTILSRYADVDGDGTTDAGFDSCSSAQIPDSAVGEIGTGVALSLLSIAAVSSSISSSAFTNITALCSNPGLSSLCTTTETSSFTALELKAFRTAIGSTDLGIGSANATGLGSCPGTFTTCICP